MSEANNVAIEILFIRLLRNSRKFPIWNNGLILDVSISLHFLNSSFLNRIMSYIRCVKLLT